MVLATLLSAEEENRMAGRLLLCRASAGHPYDTASSAAMGAGKRSGEAKVRERAHLPKCILATLGSMTGGIEQ